MLRPMIVAIRLFISVFYEHAGTFRTCSQEVVNPSPFVHRISNTFSFSITHQLFYSVPVSTNFKSLTFIFSTRHFEKKS